MSDVRWLTYDELSAELGITRESARQLAIRKRWARSKGNDGKARIGVPQEELQARTSEPTGNAMGSTTPSEPSATASDATPHDPSEPTPVAQVLTRHIERLEKELEILGTKLTAAEAERDHERARAAQVDALNAVLELERKRADELRQERDRWSAAAEAFQGQVVELTRRPRGLFGWLRKA